MTAASQSCHKDDKFFEVHLGITIFIQIPEDFISSVLVLPRLQKERSGLQWGGLHKAQKHHREHTEVRGFWWDWGQVCVCAAGIPMGRVLKAAVSALPPAKGMLLALLHLGAVAMQQHGEACFLPLKQPSSWLKLCRPQPQGHYTAEFNPVHSPNPPLKGSA